VLLAEQAPTSCDGGGPGTISEPRRGHYPTSVLARKGDVRGRAALKTAAYGFAKSSIPISCVRVVGVLGWPARGITDTARNDVVDTMLKGGWTTRRAALCSTVEQGTGARSF
jgi:hypothetical protein